MKVIAYKDLENAFGYMAPELKLDADEIMYMINKLKSYGTAKWILSSNEYFDYECSNCGYNTDGREFQCPCCESYMQMGEE